jgi:hypothetical protein
MDRYKYFRNHPRMTRATYDAAVIARHFGAYVSCHFYKMARIKGKIKRGVFLTCLFFRDLSFTKPCDLGKIGNDCEVYLVNNSFTGCINIKDIQKLT